MPANRAAAEVTPLQLSAHRYQRRRLEAALRTGTPRGTPPPRPLAAGAAVTALIAIGCVVLAVLHPRPDVGDTGFVVSRHTGALYVRVGPVWHPVLNLASARLIAASPAEPRPVPDAALAGLARGPLLGIPGAPQTLGAPLPAAAWTVCDSTDPAEPGDRSTTVIIDTDDEDQPRPALTAQDAVLVTTGTGAPSFLLRAGQRRRVTAGEPARGVSALLLNSVPEQPATTAVDPPAAMPPATLCVTWRAGAITVTGGARPPLPAGAETVPLAQADGAGPALDAVWLPPGRTGYARCPGPGGTGYLVTETGVRFPVADAAAAGDLGLPAEPAAAPCPLLTALPVGPLLSREAAAVARDVVAPASR